jgi:predicted nucleotidyltransferase
MSEMAQTYDIPGIADVVAPVAEQYGIGRLSLFGSFARGDASGDSDMDFLITERGSLCGLFALSGFQLDLEARLGRPVDVVTKEGLDDRFLSYISEDEVEIYARRS